MAKVDKHSDTWEAVKHFAHQERQEAVEALIADHLSEQQRGKIELIDQLLRLSSPQETPVIESDTYS